MGIAIWTVIVARLKKILAIKAGEADAEAKHLSGIGIARMRAAITGGFKESITEMSDSCGLESRRRS